MRTPYQIKIRRRVARYVEREGLTTVMSNAKWQRLLQIVDTLSFDVDFRFHDVRDTDPTPTKWDPDRAHTFAFFLANIDWLEMKPFSPNEIAQGNPPPTDAHMHELKQALLKANIPFSIVDGFPRIWGYIRPGTPPQWESAS